MSATNRKKKNGAATIPQTLNSYSTPRWVTRALLKTIGIDLKGKRVLECAAGEGEMCAVLVEAGALVWGVEIDSGRAAKCRAIPGVHAVACIDFLSPHFTPPECDAIITNPPYSEKVPTGEVHKSGKKKGQPKYRHRDLALEFVRKALQYAPVVAMLLRVNWAGSQARHKFHKENPSDVVVLSQRPVYVGKSSDATEYAWFIWRRGATIGTWTVYLSPELTRGRPKKAASAKVPRVRKPKTKKASAMQEATA